MITEHNNFVSNSEFSFVCSRLKNLTYDGDSFILPNISIPTFEMYGSDVDIEVPDSKLKYSPLTITFKVDENFSNYIAIHDWMNDLVLADNPFNEKDTAQIFIKNKVRKTVASGILLEIFPITLSPINLSYIDPQKVIEAEVEFEVEQFKLEKFSD